MVEANPAQQALYDITRPLTPALAVWPGDTRYRAEYTMRMADGDSVNVSAITCSAHSGTHADAFYHFDPAGATMDRMPLDAYIGPVVVVDLAADLPDGGAIEAHHLARIDLSAAQRLLIKSRSSLRSDDSWEESIVYLAPATAARLAEAGLRLFGTDAPSVDPLPSKKLDAHRILGNGNVAILEGLQLRDVPSGQYELIALPLRLDNDGSPVRAILRRLARKP